MFEGEPIFSYSRAQAIEDGVLVDVTATAKEAGLRFPTALTAAVWGKYVEVPPGVECQDEKGRLWDILWMLQWAIRASNERSSTLHYQLRVRNDNKKPKEVTLKCICGPDDDLAPCLTVMLPDED